MPAVHIDQQEVRLAELTTTDTDGTAVQFEGIIIPVIIPALDVGLWLDAYDQASQYSPGAADCRDLTRRVLDAMKQAVEGHNG